MEMKECEECLSVVKKLHTSYDNNDKIIWYKPKTANHLTITTDKEYHFELKNVGLFSLSKQGILIQTNIDGIKKMNPFPLNYIRKIEVE